MELTNKDALFKGYALNSITNLELSVVANKRVIEARDVTFFEDVFPSRTIIPTHISYDPLQFLIVVPLDI